MKAKTFLTLGATALLSGHAMAITLFQGTDAGTAAGDPRPNSNQAAVNFDTIASSLNSISTITWENQNVNAKPPLSPMTDVTVTHTNGADSYISATNTVDLGYNTTFGGSKFLEILPDSNANTNVTTFSFAKGISSFGLYITGLQDDFPGDLSVRFTDSMGNAQNIGLVKPAPVNGVTSTMFFGFTDVADAMIMSVEIWNVGNHSPTRDVYGFDDIRFTDCNPVPEPASLVALGLGAAALIRRRRKA